MQAGDAEEFTDPLTWHALAGFSGVSKDSMLMLCALHLHIAEQVEGKSLPDIILEATKCIMGLDSAGAAQVMASACPVESGVAASRRRAPGYTRRDVGSTIVAQSKRCSSPP